MGFLSSFGDIVNDQFGIGENTTHSLDNVDGFYGKLKGFDNFDTEAERYYLEDGFIRNLRPRTRSLLFQQPDIYVVIKKKMFSSLIDNSRLDLLEEKERLLIAASKRLFQNKCRILSVYEKLTKMEKLTIEADRFNTFLGPSFLNLMQGGLGDIFSISDSTKTALETMRKVLSYSEPGELTNWTTNDWDAVFSDQVGEGTGTLEITNVASVTTRASTEWGKGSATLTLEDPYNLLTITERDIDQAIADVMNPMRTGSFFKFTEVELKNRIEELKGELAVLRQQREASQITFKVSPGTVFSKRVRAILDRAGQEVLFQYSTGTQDAFEDLENSSNFFEAVASVGNFVSTGSVQISEKFLVGNDGFDINENDQLNTAEQRKFVEIIANIYTLLSQYATSRRELSKRLAETNYIRNRMRSFFNGKYIIQPMDVVSIFMNSRTTEDERQPGGFSEQQRESGNQTAQRFDTILKNIDNGLRSLSGNFAKGVSFEDVERISIVGPSFPKWLWNLFKTDITGQPTGPCIFTGLVGSGDQGVTGSWSDGKWTINVTCEDNAGYFSKGQINIKPAVDVFNSSIYDPLTPFDVSFDAATGVPLTDIGSGDFPPLLPENQKLLQSGLLVFRSGPEKGSVVGEEVYRNPNSEISFNEFRNVLHDPEGIVYRWKQGIQTLTNTGRPYPQTTVDQERAILLTAKPFAGQDVMNVISILITGQPYNFGTFLKSAIANGNSLGSSDKGTNIPAASTYIYGLLSDIEKNNVIWGNFVPYKTLVMNPNVDKFIAEQRLDIISQNEELKQKLNERARALDELSLRSYGFTPQSPTPEEDIIDPIKQKIQTLSSDISILQSQYDATVNNVLSNNQDIGVTLIGDEVISNPTLTSISDKKSTLSQRQRDELQLRQNLHKYTARRFWKVKANEDLNLFIVDDQYDKNFDIQAFERRISRGAPSLFDSEYTDVGSQINGVSKLLGLEAFASTQGHIVVRPPGYNKVPSSVFYKMFQDRDELGVKVFPDFLENLYFNQIKSIFEQIEIIEDEIRLRAIALGARNDNDIIKLITTNSDNTFNFLTRFDGDGRVGTKSLKILFSQANPDFSEGLESEALEDLGELETAISKSLRIQRLFTIDSQIVAINNFNYNVEPDKQADLLEPIRSRLRIKTGREPAGIDDLYSNDKFRRSTRNQTASRMDRVNLFSQIGNYLSERQILLRSVSNAIKNLREGVAINAPDITNENIFQGGLGKLGQPSGSNKTARTLTTPFLNRKTEIPQFLEHMIEQEDEDDIGNNSGRRFVITADRIVSLTISENPPPYTMVTVKGLFGEGFADAPSSFNTNNDGNVITSAFAVDYDMWYQYGFKASRTIEAPFFSDPDSQCAPFAVSTLLEARKNILRGSVEISGYNEFYQPGDVVYIEDRGLLFYVREVAHNFNYGKLSTTLDLTYGHSPGEYIPTMLDVVGKILYNARGFSGRFRSERFEMLGSARSLGALAFVQSFLNDEDGDIFARIGNSDPLELLLSGRYGNRNKNILSNILFSVSGGLNHVSFRRQRARIKIVYFKTASSLDSEMQDICYSIKDWLINPEQNTPNGLSLIKFDDGTGKSQPKTFGLNEEDIIIEEIDLTDSTQQLRRRIFPRQTDLVINTQGPSSAAISLGRMLDATNNSSPENFKEIIANNVIDVFVDYEEVEDTSSANNGISEAGQAANAAINAARNARS